MMTQKKLRLGLARLHVNTERKLWKVKKGCASKHPTFQELEICPNLFVIALPTAFFGLQKRRLVGSSSLLQLSCITRTAMLLSFLCRLHLAQLNASLQQIIFHSLPLNFEKFFSHFPHHSTLFFIPTRTTSHLALSLRCNFGTRSLNLENSEVAHSSYHFLPSFCT